jgi:hypothetical protein
MGDVSVVKDVGLNTALHVIDARAEFEYPGVSDGSSSRFGVDENEVAVHLLDGADTTAALAILNAVEIPTCAAAVLTVTVNIGTLLVNDTTTVIDEVNKFVLVCVAIDDTTGVIEVLLFEKSGLLAEYGVAPAGKTLVVKLKEYEVVAAALVEIGDFIS